MFTVQAEIDSPETLTLCSDLAADTAPLTVPCSPMPDGSVLDCFHTVDRVAQENGGESVCGWALWLWPRVLIEAEFHAVWRRPDGELLDVVHRRPPLPHITFLPVPGLRYQGRQVDNVRRAISALPAVREYIYLQQRRFDLLNAGHLASQHGLIQLTGKARKDWGRYEKRLRQLGRTLLSL